MLFKFCLIYCLLKLQTLFKGDEMSVNLSKGQRFSLSKDVAGLKNVLIGLGWDANSSDSNSDFDLDASVFLLGSDGKCQKDSDFIFYNNLKSSDGSVTHTGDNRTGDGDGDDEQIKVDLSKISTNVSEIVIVVTIHDAVSRRQNFGMVRNAYVRLVNEADNQQILKYDLDEDFSTETAVVFGRIYKRDSEWKFDAVGTGQSGGLEVFCRQYGLNM